MRLLSITAPMGAVMIDLSFAVITCAAINRFRGGGLGAQRLPGHPRFYAAPFVGLIAAFYQPWPVALAIGLAFLLFVWLPWGRWYTLNRRGRTESSGEPSGFERFIERLADFGGVRRDWLAFGLRNIAVMTPGFALVLWTAGFAAMMPGPAAWPPDLSIAAWAGLGEAIYAPLAVVPAFGVVALYRIGWWLDPASGTQPAEWLVGAVIGVTIAMSQELF